MNKFLFGALLGSLVPALAIYFAGGSRSACAVIGTLVPLAVALKFPRAIGRALLWIAGEREREPRIKRGVRWVNGFAITETPEGFHVPALDADSVFDTAKEAARFIRSAG